MNILSDEEVNQFIETGFVIVREAFPSLVGAKVRSALWKELGLSPDDRSGWTKNLISIPIKYHGPPFAHAFTERLSGAFDDLMGSGGYHPLTELGWWAVAFPGFENSPWAPPTAGWHVDGAHFHHHVDSADQGLLPIFLFSDIAPGGGGTAVSIGSHKITAQILAAAEPDGLHVDELSRRVIAADPLDRVLELTGHAGDVALLHPFVLHARSPNTGDAVRFICNPCPVLRKKLTVTAFAPGDRTAVERAIINALATS